MYQRSIENLTFGKLSCKKLKNDPFVDDRNFLNDTCIIQKSAIGYYSMVLRPWKDLGRDIVAGSVYLITGRNALEG